MLSKPLNILKTSIKSPRNFLVSRVVKPNLCNRSVYYKLLSLVISSVQLRTAAYLCRKLVLQVDKVSQLIKFALFVLRLCIIQGDRVVLGDHYFRWVPSCTSSNRRHL